MSHARIAIMNCPVCFDPVNEILDCGHSVHLECVQTAFNVMQLYRQHHGYPPSDCGECPLCRAVVPQVTRYFGRVVLTTEQIYQILTYPSNPFEDAVQEQISTQMNNASERDIAEYTATMSCLLWIDRKEPPSTISLKRTPRGQFCSHKRWTSVS